MEGVWNAFGGEFNVSNSEQDKNTDDRVMRWVREGVRLMVVVEEKDRIWRINEEIKCEQGRGLSHHGQRADHVPLISHAILPQLPGGQRPDKAMLFASISPFGS